MLYLKISATTTEEIRRRYSSRELAKEFGINPTTIRTHHSAIATSCLTYESGNNNTFTICSTELEMARLICTRNTFYPEIEYKKNEVAKKLGVDTKEKEQRAILEKVIQDICKEAYRTPKMGRELSFVVLKTAFHENKPKIEKLFKEKLKAID